MPLVSSLKHGVGSVGLQTDGLSFQQVPSFYIDIQSALCLSVCLFPRFPSEELNYVAKGGLHYSTGYNGIQYDRGRYSVLCGFAHVYSVVIDV
jgi:hypothetical protein